MRKSLNFDAKSLQNTGGGISQTLANRTFHAMRFAALFLFLFFIGVGNTWGDIKYYKIHVIAIDQNLNPTDAGKAYICADASWSSLQSQANDLASSDVTTGPWATLDNANSVPRVHLYVPSGQGATFLGWYYSDKTTYFSGATKVNNTTNITNATFKKVGDTPETAETMTIYAKFQVAPAVRYYGEMHFDESEQKRGVLYEVIPGSPYKYTYSVAKSAETRTGSAVIEAAWVGIQERRGFVFANEWNIVSGNGTLSSTTARTTTVSINCNRNDSTPEVVTISAVYNEAPINTLTVQKDADRGSVTAQYYNWVDNEEHDGLEKKWVDMANFVSSATTKDYEVYTSDKIKLTAHAAYGYRFSAWYSVDGEDNRTKLESDGATLEIASGTTGKYFAEFRPLGENDKFLVGMATTETLADALTLAISSEDKTIIQLRDYTVPAGNYTIPEGVTLIIPYAEEHDAPTVIVHRVSTTDIPEGAFRTLTLENGAHLNVYGTIEVGGCQTTGPLDSGADVGVGRPAAPTYGHMIMEAGSSIVLNAGSTLRAWGFVTGSGEIDARRGAEIYEQFQMMDWRGYVYTRRMFSNDVLPMSQYYIQNVEVPVKYHPGAKLLGSSSVHTTIPKSLGFVTINVPAVVTINDAGIIGVKYNQPGKKDDAAIFLMDNEDDSEDTWVRKYYDATNDRQVYEVNNAAYLGSLVMSMQAYGYDETVNSAEYVLPITNNFKIHLLSGDMIVTQNTVMLPGSEFELEKQSTVTIADTATLYLYDTDQWGTYVCNHFVDEETYEFGYGSRIKYRPGGVSEARNISTKDGQGDAKLTVHGTVNVEGRLFTTEGGAAITSTIADAGTVTFTNAAPTFSTSHVVKQVSSTIPTYVAAQCVSGLLTNGTGSAYGAFSQTAGTPAGKSFCFIDMDGGEKGEWVSMTDDGCFSHDQNGVYYIKPQKYLPISIGEPEEKADHTYRDEYGNTGKIFINIFENNNCQWWEVETVAGNPELFHCKHPQNDTYYYWYVNPLDPANTNTWQEKKFRVEFRNWNDTTLKFVNAEGETKDHYMLPYNSHPQWLSANPTRNDDANYTYTFNGWYPEINSSTVVTGDTVFMAKFTATPRQYLITFKDASGVEIETTQYAYGTTPTAPVVDMTNKKWSPAIGTVTGNQIYQLVAATSTYTVIWKNWDGTVLETDANVASGAATAFNGATPTKAADQLNSYEFNAWSPTPAATVTADAIYTATFNTVAQTYAIRFFQEDGSTPIGDPQNLAYGAMPSVPEYSKETTAAKTYTLVWSPLVSAATKNQDYVATFTEQPRQYSVTWKNYDGTTLETNYVNYGTTPVYSGVTPTDGDASTSFNGWTPTPAPVTGNQVYTAQFTTDILTISNGKTAAENETVGGTSVTTVIISKSGTIDLSAAGSNLKAENLILESDGSTASGQLLAENSQITADHIYFDFKVNAKNHKWYGVAVPWQVDATSGISVNGKTLVLGKDFDIVYYNGALRAEVGKQKCWSYVEAGEALQPGRLYMIGLMMDAQTIRFEKESEANILTTTTSVTAHSGAAASTDQGWNGVANPALFHAFVNPGVTAGQVYNPEKNSYDPILMNDAKFVVGQGAFVEVLSDKDITVTYGGAYAAAPRRARAEEAPLYDVRIAPAEAEYTDRLFVTVDDEKEADTYVIGKDLAKLGVSKSVAQMWINRYNTELCLNTMTMENGAAEYPLGIFAPKAGEYTITNEQSSMSNEYTLYLTFNGEAIWNLSDAAYTGTFDAGTTSAYGLRISARAPQITTGIDEAVVDAKGETRKVIINDKVFIIRGENVYSVDGQLVK